jgi:glucosamine-phosphate N-acetyltransferase
MDQNFTIRNLEVSDYYKEYLNLLSQLTTTLIVSYNEFCEFVNSLNLNHQILVIEDLNTNKIIGTGTVLIECKLIHGLGKVAHIEDIVTDSKFRGQGLGSHLINYLVVEAEAAGCYKVILDCAEHNVGFYTKCGFEQKGFQMAKVLITR